MERKDLLSTIWSAGRAHAICISGPWPIAKTALAEIFAAQIMGVDVAQLHRQPNFVRVSRPIDEKTGEKKKQIPLATIEELQSNLALMHTAAQTKVVLIEDADHLNDQAQNALLKNVEEPKAHTLLLFVADEPSRILPTLRSRMVQVALTPTAEETAQALAPLRDEAARFIAAPGSQRLLTAVQMTKGDEAQAADALMRFLEVLAHTLHTTLHEKYVTMTDERRQAFCSALSLCAGAPTVLRENASPTLLMEAIALALP